MPNPRLKSCSSLFDAVSAALSKIWKDHVRKKIFGLKLTETLFLTAWDLNQTNPNNKPILNINPKNFLFLTMSYGYQ